MSTRTRFEKEARDNSEMAYSRLVEMSVIKTSPPLDWHWRSLLSNEVSFNCRAICDVYLDSTCRAILCWIPLPSASRLFSSVLNDPRGANSKISAQGFTHVPTMLIILGWWRLRRNMTSWRNKRYGWFTFLGWNTYKPMVQLSVMKSVGPFIPRATIQVPRILQ